MSSTFALATSVVYGEGATQEIGLLARARGARRVLVVTDSGVRRAGLVQAAEESLHRAGLAAVIYDWVSPNPRSQECADGAQALAEAGADLVLAVGGGSVMDAAKGMAVLAGNGGTIEDYVSSLGGQPAPQPMLPLLAVPTTCGSGAEVSPTALITAVSRQKIALRPCAPAVAFVDPLLARTMPPAITAGTGMDALAHALEAYLSPTATPYTDMFAVQAIRMIGVNLLPAVEAQGEARHAPIAAMMYAANLAGFSLQAGTGQVHSLAHALGGLLDIPHSTAIAVLLPVVLGYHLDHLQARLAEVAHLLWVDGGGLREGRRAPCTLDRLRAWRERLHLPARLSGLGVAQEHLPALAALVMSPEESWRRDRPRPCTREDVLAMYRLAF